MLVAHEPQVSEMLPDAEELRAAQPWVYEMGGNVSPAPNERDRAGQAGKSPMTSS